MMRKSLWLLIFLAGCATQTKGQIGAFQQQHELATKADWQAVAQRIGSLENRVQVIGANSGDNVTTRMAVITFAVLGICTIGAAFGAAWLSNRHRVKFHSNGSCNKGGSDV